MPVRCYTCNGNHTCRQCPIEKKISGHMKKLVGTHMENHIAKEIACPKCKKHSLRVLGNNSPSLDLICTECDDVNIECKSKCLSVDKLPDDIMLNHGSYDNYISRQNNGLDFVIVIYKIDRINKLLEIRKIMYIDNNYIVSKDKNFSVEKKQGTSLSTIFIKNHNRLSTLNEDKKYVFSFKKYYDNLIASLRS